MRKENFDLVAAFKEIETLLVTKYPSAFYKMVIETPENFLNRWWTGGAD